MTGSRAERYGSKSVLVTGGAGFIGSHLTEALAASGARVAVLDNLQAGTWSNLDAVSSSVRCIEGDVRDYATLEAVFRDLVPEYVFHLAANASVPGSVTDPRYDFESNCGGTFALLETLRALKSEARMILASSAAVYGQPQRFPILETTLLCRFRRTARANCQPRSSVGHGAARTGLAPLSPGCSMATDRGCPALWSSTSCASWQITRTASRSSETESRSVTLRTSATPCPA